MIRSLFLPFNTSNYPFRKFFESALRTTDLEHLHEEHTYPHFERETDQATDCHAAFYRMTQESTTWKHTYVKFVAMFAELFREDVIYQRVPTVRFAFPGNVAVGEWHKDSTYNHSPHEINVWVPITQARDTSAVWCETYEGSDSFMPLNCNYGSALIFDAANLRHGNKDNDTGLTRVSFDFRIIPASVYEDREEGAQTINTKMKFRLPRDASERGKTYFELFRR